MRFGSIFAPVVTITARSLSKMRLTMNSGMGKMAGRGGENEAASVWNFVLNYYYFLKKRKILKN